MKSLFICLAILVITSSVHSQQTTSSPVMTKQDYLKKSKNQKTAAWLFLAAGGGLVVLAAQDVDTKVGNSDESRRTACIVASIAALSASTTLFIASARNRKKGEGEMMGLKMERAPVLQQGGLVYNSYPALSLRIKL